MSIDTSTLFEVLADDFCLRILKHIAESCKAGEVNGASVPITETSLSRRQYYRRLSIMTKIGLIVRNNNAKYSITLFGRLINTQIASINELVDHYSKIRAIDSVKLATANDPNSDQQFIGIVNNLIKDEHVKGLLFRLYPLGREQANTIAARNHNRR